MPTQSAPFFNPLDPNAALQAADIQRRQKLAETLMQGGQQQEGTQMAGNIAVPVNKWGALAKALQTTAGGYFEGQAQRDALKLQQQQYASLLSGVTGQSPPSALGQPSQGIDASNAVAGSIPGTSSASGAVPGGGLNPQAAQMALALGGPEALGTLYRENYLAHNNPTDMMKNDRWQGINPNQQRALTMSEAAKNIGVNGGQPQFDPQGNMSVVPVPGAAATQAGFTGAVAGANAKYGNPVSVTDENGKTRLVRPDILADSLDPASNSPIPNGGVSAQGPGMNLPGANPQIPPQSPMQAGPVQTSPDSALTIAPNMPGGPPPSPLPQSSPLQTQGTQGTGLPGIPVQNPAAKGQTDALNTDFINNGFRPAINSGDSAEKLNAQYQALLNNPEINNTSWSAPFQKNAAEVLNGLGMAPDAAKQMATNSETFNSGLKDLVIPKMKSQLGAGQRINKGEVAITEKTLASLGNTPEANKFLLNMGTALANPEIQKRDFYLQNIGNQKYQGNARQLETDFNAHHPSILSDPAVSGYFKGTAPQPSGPPGGTLIGTSGGKKVYALSNGQHVMEQ